jgi:hypothetical protein
MDGAYLHEIPLQYTQFINAKGDLTKVSVTHFVLSEVDGALPAFFVVVKRGARWFRKIFFMEIC